MSLLLVHEAQVVGHLQAAGSGQLRFHYQNQWRTASVALPWSLALPLSSEAHTGAAVEAVVWGLLPDNEHTLQRWARRFQVSARQPLALLRHVGADCAGAFALLPEEQLPNWRADTGGRVQWLSEQELADRLRELRQDSAQTRREGDPGQFSLAGAQPKIALLHDGRRWGIPGGRNPTTHILKPPMQFDGLAENEHYCMTLAALCQLPVARSQLFRIGQETAFCVERYDRRLDPSSGRWMRVHQEDCCQALGLMPQGKYQNEGGPGPEDIGQLLRTHSSRPQQDLESFYRALVCNWLIGGTDAHAKNYSLLIGAAGRVRLAPLYDLISFLPYSSKDSHKISLAMKIGSHYRRHELRLSDWLQLAEQLRLPRARALELLRKDLSEMPRLAIIAAAILGKQRVRTPLIDRLTASIVGFAQEVSARMAIQADASQS